MPMMALILVAWFGAGLCLALFLGNLIAANKTVGRVLDGLLPPPPEPDPQPTHVRLLDRGEWQ